MKAILCRAFEGPERLKYEDVADPIPGVGQVKIAARACGINFPDVLITQGRYQLRPPLPFSPGLEIAGEIVEVGAGVDESRLGERVMAILDYGGYAEAVVLPQALTLTMPENMSWEEGAGFSLVYGTAHIALSHRGNLRADETLLVLGAAGGVGLAAVELGSLMGARVIAAASSDEKLDLARRYGADETINYSRESLRDAVKALTNNQGADVIFDPVGGDLFDEAARRIAWEGRYLVIGFASGRIPALPANIALLKNASLVGVFWGAYLPRDPQTIGRSFRQLFSWYAAGSLKPHIHRAFPLREAADALRLMTQRRAMGKLILTV